MANEQNNPQRDQQNQSNPQQGGQNKPGQQQQGGQNKPGQQQSGQNKPGQGGQQAAANRAASTANIIVLDGGSPWQCGLPPFLCTALPGVPVPTSSPARSAYARAMANALPLFHLYGDPPDDQAFDFIHVETISSRSSIHDWTIRAHRHRNLFQILLIERGGGEMTFDAAKLAFAAPAAILVPAAIAHGFRFEPDVTDGWVVSFTEDAAGALTDRAGEALGRLRTLAAHPIVPIGEETELARLSALCKELFEEHGLAREGYRLAMRGLLVLIAVGVARLAAATPAPAASPCIRPTPRLRNCARWSTSFSARSDCLASMPKSSA